MPDTALMPVSVPQKTEHFDVLIVGAGISGVGGAYHLTKQCSDTSFVVLESQESFGGTWLTHRYPGIRSDSDLYTFGYRFKPWTSAPIATAAEILSYMGEVIAENDLGRHIRYGHRISAARWSSQDNRWTIEATRTDTGDEVRFTANFLWMCQGYYRHSEGYTPEWEGMKDFKGRIVHPQTWPEDLDYTAKKVVVIGPQRHGNLLGLLLLHMAEQAAHEVGDQVGTERPACPEVSEHPHHVRHAGEHHAAVGDRIGEVERFAVDGEVDVAQHVEIEAGGGDDDVGLEVLAGLQADSGFGEPFDLVGDHRGATGTDALEQVAVGDEGDALPPRPIGRREVRIHVVVRTEVRAHAAQQLLLHDFRLLERTTRENRLIVQDLAAHDFVDPAFVDLQLAQRVGEIVGVAGGPEIGR